MEDYIKRSDALNFDLEIECEPEDLQPMMEGMARVMDYIKKLPASDVVEVVRCRECIHRFVDGDNVRYNVCELNHNRVQSDDWFCADGERKDGGADG